MRAWIDATVARAAAEVGFPNICALLAFGSGLVIAFAPVPAQSLPIKLGLVALAAALGFFFGIVGRMRAGNEGVPEAAHLSPEELRIMAGLFLQMAAVSFVFAGGASFVKFVS